jgi:ubiquinone/menaquinone biosynthesis C-methylase UbiE
MNTQKEILLPGSIYQLSFLKKNLKIKPEKILVVGSSSEWFASELLKKYSAETQLIVEDYESLMNSKLILKDEDIKISLMNFEITDFDANTFDLIYAQASVSLTKRNKIIKEIKRILKPGGCFCVGEIVSLKKELPVFITDLYDASDLLPLNIEDIDKYYTERKFEILAKRDLSETLADYYKQSSFLLKDTKSDLTDREKSYYKKLLHKASHESNVYLKLGGDKYIGFVSLFLKKGEN